MNHYETLGVTEDATLDDIKKSYKQLAQKYHPDRNKDKDAVNKFKEINTAYQTLKDSQKRAEYDMIQHGNLDRGYSFRTGDGIHVNVSGSGFEGMSLDDILEELHGRRFGRRKSRPMAKVTISLEEAYTGTTRTLNNNEFSIPRGVRTGNKLAVDDMILVIQVQNHPKFKRSNDDLIITTEITAIEAITGTECEFTGLDEKTVRFMIPAGTQYGQIIRLRGKGMPNPEVNYIGDLLIQIIVTIPDNLTAEEKDTIMKFPHRKLINV